MGDDYDEQAAANELRFLLREQRATGPGPAGARPWPSRHVNAIASALRAAHEAGLVQGRREGIDLLLRPLEVHAPGRRNRHGRDKFWPVPRDGERRGVRLRHLPPARGEGSGTVSAFEPTIKARLLCERGDFSALLVQVDEFVRRREGKERARVTAEIVAWLKDSASPPKSHKAGCRRKAILEWAAALDEPAAKVPTDSR